MPWIILIIVVVLILLWVMGTYNSLVSLRNRVKDSWSQIDVQLKRRFDLIPNLVETVKGYTKHESETLENVIKARNTFAVPESSTSLLFNASSQIASYIFAFSIGSISLIAS